MSDVHVRIDMGAPVQYDVLIAQAAAELTSRLEKVLDIVGERVIMYLRSYTGGTRPPRYAPHFRSGAPRPAHPGGWADITFDLVRSYGWSRSGTTLTFTNSSDHAIYLENRDGYFVLRGIMEKDGIVARTVRQVVHEVIGAKVEVRIE